MFQFALGFCGWSGVVSFGRFLFDSYGISYSLSVKEQMAIRIIIDVTLHICMIY